VFLPVRKNFKDLHIAISRWYMKSCPKCGGALHSYFGEDFTCLQCGYIDYDKKITGGTNGRKENFKKSY